MRRTVASLLSIALIGCNGDAPPKIEPSSEIELKVLGAKPYPDARFGLGYALAHGFSRVDLNGSTYRQLSPDVVFRSKQIAPLPRYVAVMDQREVAWAPKPIRTLVSSQTLQLIDRTSGNQLATFTLPREGWAGDQAGKWLAGLLTPHPERQQIRPFDVSAAATVVVVPPISVLQPGDLSIRGAPVRSCPRGVFTYYDSDADHGRGELRTPNWTLLMPWGTREVHCLGGMVLIFSQYRQEDLSFIAINLGGNLVGRGYVRNNKADLGYRGYVTRIVSLEEKGGDLVVRQAHFLPGSSPDHLTTAAFEAQFRFPWSSVVMPR